MTPQVNWLLTDEKGSVRTVTDPTGARQVDLFYSAFGKIVRATGSQAPANPDDYAGMMAYTGREWDPDVDLYYHRHRWYDPVPGRFLSMDPIGFEGGDTNLYRYAENNPITQTDPLGLSARHVLPRTPTSGGYFSGLSNRPYVPTAPSVNVARVLTAGNVGLSTSLYSSQTTNPLPFIRNVSTGLRQSPWEITVGC